jgi:6,7-dimethyl-8-ribityllumazine synthase
MTQPPAILVIEGRFYSDIADELLRGACSALEANGAAFEVVTVPGALEIPQVLAAADCAGLFREPGGRYAGCVALGCVIRGETSHYDIVAGESARALMQIAVERNIPVGNGILTVENHEQALVRASVQGKNKGRDAALACLAVISARARFGRECANLARVP